MSKTNALKTLECQEISDCTRCGETLLLPIPMRLATFAALLEGFVRAHADCRERTPVQEEPCQPPSQKK